jgi:type IV secretion system protein VirB10
MPVKELGDPRLQALFGASDPRESDIRPTIELPGKGLPTWALALAMLCLAVLLFAVLNNRRTSFAEVPPDNAADRSGMAWDAPAPLYIPVAPKPELEAQPVAPAAMPQTIIAPLPTPRVQAPQIVYAPQPAPQLVGPPPSSPPPRVSAGSPLVIDAGSAPPNSAGSPERSALSSSFMQGVGRVRASAFANRSTTVPQGHLIPAVLETGFDSTQPGFARAIVSRDVRGFDGKNVLVPRGSHLIGEYRSEVIQGQKRAVIVWTRLIRPDGMTIAMDSPAVDTLGRGGVAASVNTHFFSRLGDALLQTTIGLGSALAQQRLTGPVVVVSGNTTAAAAQLAPVNNYVPTLTVPAGKSISVFVAHDLDFSAAMDP